MCLVKNAFLLLLEYFAASRGWSRYWFVQRPSHARQLVYCKCIVRAVPFVIWIINIFMLNQVSFKPEIVHSPIQGSTDCEDERYFSITVLCFSEAPKPISMHIKSVSCLADIRRAVWLLRALQKWVTVIFVTFINWVFLLKRVCRRYSNLNVCLTLLEENQFWNSPK